MAYFGKEDSAWTRNLIKVRSCHPEVFCEKTFAKNSEKFHKIHKKTPVRKYMLSAKIN